MCLGADWEDTYNMIYKFIFINGTVDRAIVFVSGDLGSIPGSDCDCILIFYV
jgi:hypothetical protein